MGILDDAIKEHLDLKRRHGARESELREIEEDAFGSGEGPDPFAAGELFQGTAAPGGPESGTGPPTPPGGAGAGGDEPTRLLEPRGSAEAPPAEAPPAVPPSAEPPSLEREPAMPPIPGEERATPPPPSGEPATPPPPGGAPEPPPFEPGTPTSREPGPPAGIDEPPETSESPGGDPALESQSLAELMAEEDVEPDPGAPGPSASGTVPEAPPTPAPSDEGLAPTDAPREPAPPGPPPEPETSEPELPLEPEPPSEPEAPSAGPEPDAPEAGAAAETPDFPAETTDFPGDAAEVPDPPPPPPPGSEPPGRARGRVHHPTEEFASQEGTPEPESEEVAPPSSGPLEPEGTRVGPDEAAPAPGEPGGPALFDFETEDEPLAAPPADEFEDLGPVSDEPYPEDEPYAEAPPAEAPPAEAPPAAPDQDEGYAEPGTEESFVDPGTDEDYVVPEEAPAEPSTEEGALPEPAGGEGEDLLADSPDFADEGGEDEEQDLWFEKGPPQDFDFEDEDR